MIDSFKHHFQDVLPQKASDVSGVVKNRGAQVSGPHVPVGGGVNVSDSSHLFHAVMDDMLFDGEFLR